MLSVRAEGGCQAARCLTAVQLGLSAWPAYPGRHAPLLRGCVPSRVPPAASNTLEQPCVAASQVPAVVEEMVGGKWEASDLLPVNPSGEELQQMREALLLKRTAERAAKKEKKKDKAAAAAAAVGGGSGEAAEVAAAGGKRAAENGDAAAAAAKNGANGAPAAAAAGAKRFKAAGGDVAREAEELRAGRLDARVRVGQGSLPRFPWRIGSWALDGHLSSHSPCCFPSPLPLQS